MTVPLPADDRRPIATVAIIGNDAVLAAAPATPVQLAHACLRRGFTVAVPVTWGDELLASEAVRRLSSRARGPAVMCVCPFVRSRLLAPGPDLAPFLVSLVPPPVATARYLRTVYGDRGVHITYIGACPGADDLAIDARLTPDTFLGELAEHGISLAEQPLVFDSIVPPDRRRWCSLPGGVPSAEVLWSDTDTRTLVEIERDDISTDLAQHIIARDHVLLDLAPSLGCSCSGAIPSIPTRSARVAVTALEPPRALGPVIEPVATIPLDAPVDGVPLMQSPAPVAVMPRPEIDSDARERALDMILGGDPEPSNDVVERHTRTSPRMGEASRTDDVARRTDIESRPTAEPKPSNPAPPPVLLETFIDDIIIEPLIIPDTKPPVVESPIVPVAEPSPEQAERRVAGEVLVELDVVREVVPEASAFSVRYEAPPASILTRSVDVPTSVAAENAGGIAVSAVEERVEQPASVPDDSSASQAAAMASVVPEAPTAGDPVVADDEAATSTAAQQDPSSVRRKTPPAMPARHPASSIPKAVAADGRPLPRAYVAKRRMTPTGNTAVHQPASVVPVPDESESGHTSGESVSAAPADPALPNTTAASPESTTPEAVPPAEAAVRHDDTAVVSMSPTEDEEPSPPSESVWGVTVEAPVVTKPNVGSPDPTASSGPIRLASSPIDVAVQRTSENRGESVAVPSPSRNALITVMVVALVTLAVSVFVLLRR